MRCWRPPRATCCDVVERQPPIGSFAADEHGVTATSAAAAPLRTRLLVAADGRARPARSGRYQDRALGLSRRSASSRRSVTRSRMRAAPYSISCLQGRLRSCRCATIAPASPGRRTRRTRRAILALDDAGFLSEVEKRFGYRLGAIALAGPARVMAARACIWRALWLPIALRWSAMRRTACTRLPARASTSACAMWRRWRRRLWTQRAWVSTSAR